MVERADIEAKAREIEQALNETRESVQQKGVVIAVAVIAVVVLAFVIGRRRGSRSRAVVKVYRS
ncbi:hypothetical protein BMS3Abin02_00094 [bacterium BMS3Abin02]|nr:hypothetical protein BMS3Abin02_00094 [bacterium BMS3Abin02]GBE21948.1 hypothetical protein BMS3Bbin01_01302 [bacterium BMS3Bbin01]HDH25342.1 hypothetical protein [Actinomycetota bacterium]HDK45465.1 hypothetical protein [Actinomycetota bacterium]